MCPMSNPRTALEHAAQAVGGFAQLADLLKVSRQAVYKWLETKVPPKRCADVERVSGVKREKLRPDIYGRPSRESARAA